MQCLYKGLGTAEMQTKASHTHTLPRQLHLSSALRQSFSPPSLLPRKDSEEDKRVLSYPFLISSSPCGEGRQVRGVSWALQLGDTVMALEQQSVQRASSYLYRTASMAEPATGLLHPARLLQRATASYGQNTTDVIPLLSHFISSNCMFSIFSSIFKKPSQYSKLWSSSVNWVLYMTYRVYQHLSLAAEALTGPLPVLYSLLT